MGAVISKLLDTLVYRSRSPVLTLEVLCRALLRVADIGFTMRGWCVSVINDILLGCIGYGHRVISMNTWCALCVIVGIRGRGLCAIPITHMAVRISRCAHRNA